jgi:hypothetical protein
MINPVVKFVLRSPLHGLMSHNTVLLEFKGRKSGKTYSTPVSYHISNGHVHCFTEKSNQWWRNLRHADEIELTLQGRRIKGSPTVLADGSTQVQSALHDFLVATPRDASHAGVAIDAHGHPVAADIRAASQHLALISIDIRDRAMPPE